MNILLKQYTRMYSEIQVSSSNTRSLQIAVSTCTGQEARWLFFRRHSQGADSQYLEI